MGRSLDSNIYGADETSSASRVASEALDSSVGQADYWGELMDDRAVAKANVGEESTDDFQILSGRANKSTSNKGRGDTEPILKNYPQMQRAPRHVPGPRTAADEGGGVKRGAVPANQSATRKGGSPKP